MESERKLKASGTLYRESFHIFKKFVIDFVRSLNSDDRAAFRFFCLDLIPQGKLEMNIADDNDIYDLIVLLLNDNKVSLTNMCLLNEFLTKIDSAILLEKLIYVESRIAIRIVLKAYAEASSADGLQYGLGDMYANIVKFLLSTKDENEELFSEALENLNQVKEYSTALAVINGVIKGCENGYSTIIATLVILGEIYTSTSTEEQVRLLTPSIDLIAEWILKHGGLDAFDAYLKKKSKSTNSEFALPSIEESVKENIKLIGYHVDVQLNVQ